jgi:hypothetical protein
VISTGLVETLTAAELAAVLAHEQVHQQCRDPLRMLLAAALTGHGLCLPALPARFVVGRELAADRRAMDRYGKRAGRSAAEGHRRPTTVRHGSRGHGRTTAPPSPPEATGNRYPGGFPT